MNPVVTDDRPRVLIVDDEKFIRDILADFLGMEGYVVRTAEDGVAALSELSREHYDLVISDLKMPRMGGIELLGAMSQAAPHALAVIMTGFGTVETAIDAMKRGAYDYILKPFKVEEVIHVVQRGIEKQRLTAENLRLREALSLYKVSEAIAASLSLEDVLGTLANAATQEIDGDLVSIWFDDGQGGFFERQRIVQHKGNGGPIDLGALDPQVFAAHFACDTLLIAQAAEVTRFFATKPGVAPHSMVAVPLRAKSKLIGWVSALSFTTTRKFNEGHRKLLAIVASRAAASIENAMLYADLQDTFQQTIEGLAQAIDKMDRYTAGHSERVATYSVFLAMRIGLPLERIEMVRQSALMHDIGKIGCVLNLNKPGKLTQAEYEEFKKHPGFGKEILEPIKFLAPLIEGVHSHHERWDGRGYPLAQKGEEIPVIGRIIAVADTYDAMTSDRAYRTALPHEVSMNEIERCSGTQFDPEIARTFVSKIDEFREEQLAEGKPIPD